MPPSFGNATIGEVPSIYMGNKPVISPIAVNAMQVGVPNAGMMNAHVGQNYNVSEPDPKRAALLAADGTPGVSGNGAFIAWAIPPGVWVAG